MNSQTIHQTRRGFTLVELLVAMGITTIIVGVLVQVTAFALDTWNSSRAELRASQQAKAMLDVVGRDFESMVIRRNNKFEWLSAEFDREEIGTNLKSANAARLVFFTGVNDRYKGQIGVEGEDNGGDISCVGYQLQYRNPLSETDPGFETYVFNRLLIDPDKAFKDLLGQEDLQQAFSGYAIELREPKNFVCENLLQFSVTFHVEVTQESSGNNSVVKQVPVKIGETESGEATTSFKFNSKGIDSQFSGGGVSSDELAGGRIAAVEVAITVLSDFAVDQLRNRKFKTPKQQAEFVTKNSYEFTKLVSIPAS
jgi:prepilin-type N-terminal cleavage/methylation domain-containing protein